MRVLRTIPASNQLEFSPWRNERTRPRAHAQSNDQPIANPDECRVRSEYPSLIRPSCWQTVAIVTSGPMSRLYRLRRILACTEIRSVLSRCGRGGSDTNNHRVTCYPKLLAQANNLNDPPSAAAAAPTEKNTELQQPRSAENAPALPPPGDTIMRLHRAVLEELGAVEAMRARLKREPHDPADAERTARTLSSLTETLQKLQRLQCALQETGFKDDDDMPVDIDEFRKELARRIRVFVESRTERGHVEGAGTPPLASVRS